MLIDDTNEGKIRQLEKLVCDLMNRVQILEHVQISTEPRFIKNCDLYYKEPQEINAIWVVDPKTLPRY